MEWVTTSSIPVSCTQDDFQNAVKIWFNRPNVCSKIISCAKIDEFGCEHDTEILLDFYCNSSSTTTITTSEENQEQFFTREVFLRELIPKKPNIHLPCREIVVFSSDCVTFLPLLDDGVSIDQGHTMYSVRYSRFTRNDLTGPKLEQTPLSPMKNIGVNLNDYQSQEFCIKLEIKNSISNSTDPSDKGVMKDVNLKPCFPDRKWLKEKFLPQIAKWCDEESQKSHMVVTEKRVGLELPHSLSLISQHKYSTLYHRLKKKYGAEMIKVWTEVTDPQKYIYEDIAIATYLILVWEKEREQTGSGRLQSFVDLGCGNGLLVHILTSEGHPGKGVDLRRRNIWDVYPKQDNLVEAAIDPTSGTTYGEFDWLLGNHSDELTPWIPVLAARSGYNVRYWVLPCCFFDFFHKYKRSQSVHGQYDDYLGFVREIGTACGFDVQVDVMRIPSTKRVCQIGIGKLYPESKHAEVLMQIDHYVGSRTSFTSKSVTPEGHFEAREKEEKVRNCTRMERKIQEKIVDWITSKLLEDENAVKIEIDGCCKEWNRGGSMTLEDVALLLDEEVKILMKNECGGLQTLLRNHHQIFEIKKGRVSIRDWSNTELNPRRKKNRSCVHRNMRKTKLCWFYDKHPDRCPRVTKDCPFMHGAEDVAE